MPNRSNYEITKHLRDRYIQRTIKKFDHLNVCKRYCETCKFVQYDLMDYIQDHRNEINAELHYQIGMAEEDRSYVNNFDFMAKLYAKYGYDVKFEFLVFGKLVFVAIIDGTRRPVVTCVPSNQHVAGQIYQRTKFRKAKAM